MATEILDHLIQSGIGSRPFFLIGHSLGGLQIKELISISYQKMVQESKTQGAKNLSLEKRANVGPAPPLNPRKKRLNLNASSNILLQQQQQEQQQQFYTSFIENCHGIIFYGVPHRGSNLASLVTKFGLLIQPTHSVHDLHPTSTSLVKLHEEFLEICSKHQFLKSNIVNLIEKGKVMGMVQIVEDWSSMLPPNFIDLPLDFDHLDICTPESKLLPNYSIPLDFIKAWAPCSYNK